MWATKVPSSFRKYQLTWVLLCSSFFLFDICACSEWVESLKCVASSKKIQLFYTASVVCWQLPVFVTLWSGLLVFHNDGVMTRVTSLQKRIEPASPFPHFKFLMQKNAMEHTHTPKRDKDEANFVSGTQSRWFRTPLCLDSCVFIVSFLFPEQMDARHCPLSSRSQNEKENKKSHQSVDVRRAAGSSCKLSVGMCRKWFRNIVFPEILLTAVHTKVGNNPTTTTPKSVKEPQFLHRKNLENQPQKRQGQKSSIPQMSGSNMPCWKWNQTGREGLAIWINMVLFVV